MEPSGSLVFAFNVLQDLPDHQGATVNTMWEGRLVIELSEITRGGLDLLVSSPGVPTPNDNRGSSLNGMRNSALNVTIEGLKPGPVANVLQLAQANGYLDARTLSSPRPLTRSIRW